MNSVLRIISLAAVIFIMLASAGCEVPPSGTEPNTNTANSNTAQPSAANSNTSMDQMAVPLPVLDAFFADQNFAGELKSRLELTDEQVAQLRNVAQKSRESLRETENDENYQGTSSAARQQAITEIEAVIGRQKTEQLFAFVREKWGGAGAADSASMLSSTPGSVPQDTRIVINAPAFRMDVFNNGQLVKTYRIGIGYPEFPLPTGLRHADTILFNPTWTPPDEPWVGGSDSRVKPGETIEAGDKLNPLGMAKIPIGLPSLIHGGKSPSKIGSFASHGCVGLTDQQLIDFAKTLAEISGTTLTDAQIAEYRRKKTETHPVKLNTPVPVELRYETITVEDGRLHIYRDVYDRNTNTEENLRAVLQAHGMSVDQMSEAERSQALAALEQMSRDVATGKPDTAGSQSDANRNASGRVTRTIKGQKEMTVDIAGLQGKGYPAPVNLNAGNTNKANTQPARSRAGRR